MAWLTTQRWSVRLGDGGSYNSNTGWRAIDGRVNVIRSELVGRTPKIAINRRSGITFPVNVTAALVSGQLPAGLTLKTDPVAISGGGANDYSVFSGTLSAIVTDGLIHEAQIRLTYTSTGDQADLLFAWTYASAKRPASASRTGSVAVAVGVALSSAANVAAADWLFGTDGAAPAGFSDGLYLQYLASNGGSTEPLAGSASSGSGMADPMADAVTLSLAAGTLPPGVVLAASGALSSREVERRGFDGTDTAFTLVQSGSTSQSVHGRVSTATVKSVRALTGAPTTAGTWSGIILRMTDAQGDTVDSAPFSIVVGGGGGGNPDPDPDPDPDPQPTVRRSRVTTSSWIG